MFFSTEQIKQLKEGQLAVSGKKKGLLDAYLLRTYNNSKAKEYAQHGFSRRLNTLVRCIDKIFEILPPDQEDRT